MVEEQGKIEENIINVITKAIESIAVYKGMISIIDSFKDNFVFITLLNNCAMISIIRVCNIFGTDNENNHWKKLVSNCEIFRNEVILPVFGTLFEYKEYNSKLMKFRNNFAVHSIYDNNVELPKLDKSLELLVTTLKYILNNYNFIIEEDPIIDAQNFYNKIIEDTISIFIK